MEENNENVNLVENILNEEEDNINIAEEVITTIAGIAVSEISGVAEMAGGIAGKKNLSKGIKAETDGNNVKIDVNIIVNYGVRIPDVAFDIQNKVKQSVETMTGLKVNEVNVHVQGVNIEKTEEN